MKKSLTFPRLRIAAKCHFQDFKIRPVDLARCADKEFTVEQLLFYEGAVLSTLKWELDRPTLLTYVNALRSSESLDRLQEEDFIVQYLSSLALQSQAFKKITITKLAAAVIMMTRFWLQLEGRQLWSDEIYLISGCSFEEVCSDVVLLSNHLEEIRQRHPHLQVITRYYSTRSSSGDLTVPLITSTAPLVAYQARSLIQNTS